MDLYLLPADLLEHILLFVYQDRICAASKSSKPGYHLKTARLCVCAIVTHFPCSSCIQSMPCFPLKSAICSAHNSKLRVAYEKVCRNMRARSRQSRNLDIDEESEVVSLFVSPNKIFLHGTEILLTEHIDFDASDWKMKGRCCSGTGVVLCEQ